MKKVLKLISYSEKKFVDQSLDYARQRKKAAETLTS